MKFSVIIPVYNVEPYLSKCLESVLNQDIDIQEYEIIIINDGSTDKSAEIITQFKNSYSNIVYVEQETQGVSVARNKGLDIAKGEYILFVDADDQLYFNVLNSISSTVVNNNLDLLYLKIEYFNEKDQYLGYFKMDKAEVEILDGFQHQRRGYICGVYRRELIDGIRFVPDIPIGEDALFNIKVHVVAERCSYYNKSSYRYYKRHMSALNSKLKYTDAAYFGFIKTIGELKIIVEDNKERFTNEEIKYFDRPFFKTIVMTLRSSVIPSLSISRYKILKEAISVHKIGYLTPQISESVKYFDRHWTLFFSYYALKKSYSFILEKLSKLKRKLIKND